MNEKKLYMAIGAIIRLHRRIGKIKQSELADACEMQRSSIANIEAGMQRIPIHKLILVCKHLKITTGKLLGQAGVLSDE